MDYVAAKRGDVVEQMEVEEGEVGSSSSLKVVGTAVSEDGKMDVVVPTMNEEKTSKDGCKVHVEDDEDRQQQEQIPQVNSLFKQNIIEYTSQSQKEDSNNWVRRSSRSRNEVIPFGSEVKHQSSPSSRYAGAKVRAPRGKSRRLSSAVVVNARRSKLTVRWVKPGNTTSRVHVDDVVFLKKDEDFESSDSDQDFDLRRVTPERRARDSHLSRQRKVQQRNLRESKSKKKHDEDFETSSSSDDDDDDVGYRRSSRKRKATQKKINYDESKNDFFDEKEMLASDKEEEATPKKLYAMERFLGVCTMPASHWEKLCATFTTAYVINGSMDNSPDIFECEHGCGMVLFLSLSLSL